MADVLAKIISGKRDEVATLIQTSSMADLDRAARAASPVRGFTAALAAASASGYGLIGELKKASPSKGLIRTNFTPEDLAAAYKAGGATCLSVLTDGPWFQGAPEYLVAARNAVSLPVLRKDFWQPANQATHDQIEYERGGENGTTPRGSSWLLLLGILHMNVFFPLFEN